MSDKRKIVVTLNTILKVVAVLALLTGVVFFIFEVRNETPIGEIFTQNWAMWIAVLLPSFVVFTTWLTERKDK